MTEPTLTQVDPEIASLIQKEEQRQLDVIRLIASENYASRAVIVHSAAGAIIAVLAVLALAADQFTKYLALENLPLGVPVPVIGDFLIL